MQSNDRFLKQLRQGRLEHTERLAERIADRIATAWNGLKWACATVAAAQRARDPDKVFTFEA